MATRGQQGPSADRDFDLPAVAWQELPQGAEKKREAVSCLGDARGERVAGVEMRKPRISPPRGLLLLFVTNSAPEAAEVAKALQKTAPPPGSRKPTGEVVSQRGRTRLGPGRYKKERGLASKTFPHLLAAQSPCPHNTGAPLMPSASRDAHPQLLALGTMGKWRRLRNSSSSLGTSWFKYRMPWRKEERQPVIRFSCVIRRAWCKMKTCGPFQNDKEFQDSQSRALNQARALLGTGRG